MALPPRMPPRGNPIPTATAAPRREMDYAVRQRGRAAVAALTPIKGETLSDFLDRFLTAMREVPFPPSEVAAAKALGVKLVDLGVELPSAAAKPAVAVKAAVAAVPIAAVVAATSVDEDDGDNGSEVDPDYVAHTVPPEPRDPYDDGYNDPFLEPEDLLPAATAAAVAIGTAPAPVAAEAPKRPRPQLPDFIHRNVDPPPAKFEASATVEAAAVDDDPDSNSHQLERDLAIAAEAAEPKDPFDDGYDDPVVHPDDDLPVCAPITAPTPVAAAETPRRRSPLTLPTFIERPAPVPPPAAPAADDDEEWKETPMPSWIK